MAKKQKKVPVQKRTGRVALISLFCAAAGVYAADTTDGWSYNAETATIEHNGESIRLTPIQKGNQLGDTSIKPVSNVKVSGSAKMLEDGVVFDGGEAKTGTLTMEEGAVLDSDRVTATGAALEKVTTVKFEDGVKGKIDAAGATISAENHLSATAVSGDEIESITAKEISAKTVDVDNRNATAIDAIKIGSINVDKVVGDVKVGQIKNATIGELDGNVTVSEKVDENLSIGKLNGGTIKAGEVTETVTVSEGTGTIEVAKAGGIDVATVNGKLDIDGQNISSDGDLSIKNTAIADGGTLRIRKLDTDLDAKGLFKGDLTVDSNTGEIVVANIDGVLTANDAQNKIRVWESAKAVNATLNNADLTISNTEGTVTVDNVAVSGTGNVLIDNNTADGSVNVGKLDGELMANNAQGDINVTTSATKIDATLNGGNVNAENATIGSAKISTAEGAKGDVVIGTNTGSVELGTLDGKLTINNAQGDIKVTEKASAVEAALNGGNIGGKEIGSITVKDNIDGSSSQGSIDVDKVGTIKLDGDLNGDIFVNEEVNKIDAEGKKVTGDVIIEKIASAEGSNGSATIGTVEGDVMVGTLDKNAQLNVDTLTDNATIGSTGKLSVDDAQGDINVSNSVNEVEVALNGGSLNITNAEKTASTGDVSISGEGNTTVDNVGTINISDGLKGNVTVDNAGTMNIAGNITGDVTADKAGTINIGGDLTGDLTISNTVDTINGGSLGLGKTVDGNVNVAQNTGSITLGNVTGELNLGDVQGNVDIFQKAGSVDAKLSGAQLRVSQVDEKGTAKVDGRGNVVIGKASSIEANTSNGNLRLDDKNLQINGGDLTVDVANVSKREDGTAASVAASGTLDSVEIKNVGDGTNVSFNDVTTANGGTGTVDITDSKVGTVTAKGTVEGNFNVSNVEGDFNVSNVGGDFNVSNLEGKIASEGSINGTTNINDFTGDAEFNTVNDMNITSSDPAKKGIDGSLKVKQGKGDIAFRAGATDVDINLDNGSVWTDTDVVIDNAKFSGEGWVDATVDKLESFDQIKDSVEIDGKKLTSDGKLNSRIEVKSGDFTITNADSVTVDAHNEDGGRKLTITGTIAEDVSIKRIGKEGVAVAAGNATIGGDLDIRIADGSVNVGTVEDNTSIRTAKGDVTIREAKDVKIGTANGSVAIDNGKEIAIGDANENVNIGTATGNVEIGDIAEGKVATIGKAADIDINGKGSLKVTNEAGDITISKRLGGIDAETVANVRAGDATIDGNVTIRKAEDVKIGTANGSVAIDNGKEIAIGDANENVNIGTATGNVEIGDIAEGKVATIGKAADIDINGKGSLTVTEAENITAGNIKTVDVKTANGDINIVTAEDLKFNLVKGDVKVFDEIKNVNGGNVNGDVSIAKNTGNVNLNTVGNNLKLSDVAGGTSRVVEVKNKAEITTSAGTTTIERTKQLDATVNGGTLTAKTVSDIANMTVNSGMARIGSAKSLDANVNGGNLVVDNVAAGANITANVNGGNLNVTKVDAGANATVKANGGKSIFGTIAGKLKALLNGGNVEVANNVKDVEISGNGNATVKESTGTLNIETSTADKFAKNSNGGISTKGNLNVDINKATSANFGTINGGDIVGMTKIDNLTVSESTGILNIGLVGDQVKGNIVIEKATADVNVGNVANLDVTLRNNANLIALDGTKVDNAKVNGGCDASYFNVGTLKVDRGLDGNLEVRGSVDTSAEIKNVSGTVAINEVAAGANASVKNAGSAIVDKANGNVKFSDFASGSATVNNATAAIEATNVAGGLNIGNVTSVKVNNTNVNVLGGNTVNGNIESANSMTLSNSGTVTIGNSGQIVVNGDLNVANEFKFAESTKTGAVIKANSLSGAGVTKTLDNFFNAKFGFSGDESVMEAAALKGTHNAGSSYIDANIDDTSVSHTYVDVTYKNTDGSKVGYEITKNSYLSDNFATSDNEKALAEIYDNLVFQDDAEKDAESVEKKKAFKSLAENGNIGAMLPQAVNRAARMNMDLSNMVHLDTINRTAYTRDMLNRINYLKAKGKLLGRQKDVLAGTNSVTVRNINRFASYSGDGNIAGSNDSIYGGLANAEYVFDDSLFAGIGIGGFQAKSSGKNGSGKAETQSFAVNAYVDYLFYDNFDWYFGLTYTYGMNEAERNSAFSMNKGKWDSNLVGAFTGVRYAWKPIADREFYIKPLLGMNTSFLMNPSFTENGETERLNVDSEDYTSVKGIAGVEASYLFDCGLSVAGRMFYTHEFADNRYDITSSFVGSGYSVNSFRTLGDEMKRDSGIFGVGLGYDINPDWRVYLDYAAEVSGDVYHNLNAGVQLKF